MTASGFDETGYPLSAKLGLARTAGNKTKEIRVAFLKERKPKKSLDKRQKSLLRRVARVPLFQDHFGFFVNPITFGIGGVTSFTKRSLSPDPFIPTLSNSIPLNEKYKLASEPPSKYMAL